MYQHFHSGLTWALWETEPKAGLGCNPRALRVREKGNEADTWWYRSPVRELPQDLPVEKERENFCVIPRPPSLFGQSLPQG